MKELIRVRVQYASRQQCCKTHKRPLPLPFTSLHSFLPLTFLLYFSALHSDYDVPFAARVLYLKPCISHYTCILFFLPVPATSWHVGQFLQTIDLEFLSAHTQHFPMFYFLARSNKTRFYITFLLILTYFFPPQMLFFSTTFVIIIYERNPQHAFFRRGK